MDCLCSSFKNIFSKKQVSEEMGGVKIYTYNELRKATGDFNAANKLGKGGFGTVYKARIKNGSIVAVKVLSTESKQGVREFLNEITAISGIIHENLVQLLGCCIEKDQRILVYNYIENNSLAKTLLGENCLNLNFSWKARTRICIGIARGLAFLHEEVHPRIVHRDIKADNILLDKDLNPKIADFGLARLLPPNKTYVSTRVAGTVGYLAPEYAVGGHLTRRSDIYSFGVLLLEIISGRYNMSALPMDAPLHPEKPLDGMHQILLFNVWSLHERNELLTIVDDSLNGSFDAEEASRFLKIALLCTQDSPRLRPTMSTVVKMLTGEIDISLEKITKPGIIADFKDLKIRNTKKVQKKTKVEPSSSSGSSSSDTMQASLSIATM